MRHHSVTAASVGSADKNATNFIDPESGRPSLLMGHSFRVLAAYDSYSAGRSDLRLLSGDAFSVYNVQIISIVNFIPNSRK